MDIKDCKDSEIVYWAERNRDGKYIVSFGKVYCTTDVGALIDYLTCKENRRINGIPIEEFNDTEYKKLPKGWTYSTPLYELTYDPIVSDSKFFDKKNPKSIKDALEKGLLIERNKKFDGEITTDITKNGYRILLTHPMFRIKEPKTATVPYYKLHKGYEEAKKEADAENAEILRQASLTDTEWSIELIDKTLARYKKLYGVSDEWVQKVRETLVNDSKIDEIETRIYMGEFQWKYWKNKRWAAIKAEDF